MKTLNKHLIKSIIQSKNTQSAEELINLEEQSKLIIQSYNQIHCVVKKKTQGIKANLTRLVESSQTYSRILIEAQVLKVTIDDLKESSVIAHKKHQRYMSRKQRDYYELMMNYIRAISLSVEIITNDSIPYWSAKSIRILEPPILVIIASDGLSSMRGTCL